MAWVAIGLTIASFIYTLYMQSRMPGAPKPQNVQRPTASEGVPIPVVFGTREVAAPNITWFGAQEISYVPHQTYSNNNVSIDNRSMANFYRGALQIGICHGYVDAVLDVLYSDKSAKDGAMNAFTGVQSLDSFHGHFDNQQEGVQGTVKLNAGLVNHTSTTTGTNDFLAQNMSLPAADGSAPSLATAIGPNYFGVATALVRAGFGPSPYLRGMSFVVKRMHTRNGGTSAQWYDAKVEISRGTRSRQDVWKYKTQAASDSTDYSSPTYDDSGWSQGNGGIGNAPLGYDAGADYNGTYPVPTTGTQLASDGTLIKGTWPNQSVQQGMKLWLRWDLGPLPVYPLNVKCWHDDSGKLWFNGTQVTLTPTIDTTNVEVQHFNSMAIVDKSLINPAGPNVIAFRVTDSFDQSGNRIGTNKYIYAGLQVGPDDNAPTGVADMNPAHIIHEVLTDSIWGMGYTDADLDDTAFRAAADTLYDEGLGMSFVWSEQSTIEEFLTDVLRHISGVLYVDRTTGLFVLKLLRDDYVVGDLLVLDESNISKVEDASRKQIGEIVNTVTITYAATLKGDQGSITLYDEGVMQSQGGAVSAKIDYPAITSPVNAAKLALRDLRMLSSPLLNCKFTAGRAAAGLRIGDAFVMNWPDLGITNFVMRVTEIDIGSSTSNEVKIQCLEDVFFFPTQSVSGSNDPIGIPPIVTPLGAFAGVDDYYTEMVLDDRNKGMRESVFNGSAFGPGGGVFANWTEIAPGVMERNTTGPLSAGMFDDIDPFTGVVSGSGYTSGQLWFVGRSAFALSAAGDLPGNGQQYQGPYIIDDLGWDPVNMVATKARMHRDPSFSSSSQFKKNMVFQVRNGTSFGGHFLQLGTDNVVLGTTPQAWTDVGTSFTFTDQTELLRGDQIPTQNVSPDPSLELVTTAIANVHDIQAFPTLLGSFPSSSIPEGIWKFYPSPCFITGQSAGSVTTIGYKVQVYPATGSPTTLFEVLTEAIDWSAFQAPTDIQFQGAQYTVGLTDYLVMIPTIHTTSTTLVTLHMQYNAINAVRVTMPKSITDGKTTTALDESFFPVTIDANGAISGFGSHRNLLVIGGGPLVSIDTTGLVGGVSLDITFKVATTVTGNGTPVTGAAILTTKNAAGVYQGLAAPINAMLTFKLRTDSGTAAFWQYSGGTSR